MPEREMFGDVDLTPLASFYQNVDRMRLRLEQADAFHKTQPPTTLTARRTDLAQTAGHRTYIGARALLATSLDHHDAVPHLLQSGHGMTPFAPWTLVRSIFETSVWVIWILEPKASQIRRERGLLREWLDHQEFRKWEDAALKGKSKARIKRATQHSVEATATYQREATQLGLTWETWKYSTFGVVDEVKKLTTIKHWIAGQEQTLELLWRIMSGHAHGYSWAIQAGGTVERSTTIQGGLETMLTINEETFFVHLQGAMTLLLNAMELYVERSTKPAS